MKSKSEDEVAKNFAKFLKDVDYKIKCIESDEGYEFVNKSFKRLCDENQIQHIYQRKENSPNFTAIVERFNKTIRR